MDRNLALEVVRVTEAAALASARLMGRGDAAACDRAAAEAMHRAFEGIAADGSIVIGEGREGAVERLWVGERIGEAAAGAEIDVALAYCGVSSVQELGPESLVLPPGFGRF